MLTTPRAAPTVAPQARARSATSSSTCENISLAFGGVKALTDISFDVREHEIRAIIGPNGAGKSSMLNCINGVYQPQQGSITFRGQTFKHMNSPPGGRDGRGAHLPEPGAVQGHERARQHHDRAQPEDEEQPVPAGAAHRARPSARRSSTASSSRRIIDFLEIQAYRKTPVGQLPYGLQKRVDLGRALAMEPQVLLLDEPMAGMNVEEKQDMCRFILDVNDEFGTTIVLIEHDMGVVMDISRPRGGARLRQEDRRRHARRGARQPGRDQRLPRDRTEALTWASSSKPCSAA